MKIYPVIGDYGEFSRALRNTGVMNPLIPFSDYGKDYTSLSPQRTDKETP